MKHEFTYPSSDGKTNIHAIEWIPDEKPRAAVQILHGMVEFIDRYDDFAEFLNKNGIYAAGNDHLGHGSSVTSEKELGFFHEGDGNECVIADIHTLHNKIREKYPDIPIFLLGHSMGSFLGRQYIEMYGNDLTGAIISGTAYIPISQLRFAEWIARCLAKMHGSHYISPLLDKLGIGSYNKKFEPARTPDDWLTKDTEIVDRYVKNPLNQFHFTVNAYYHMFRGLEYAEKDENIRKIPDHLPILLASGQDDPVGGEGEGVKKVYDSFLKNGKTNVTFRLYENDRHEILNETDRDKVYQDMLSFLEEHIPE